MSGYMIYPDCMKSTGHEPRPITFMYQRKQDKKMYCPSNIRYIYGYLYQSLYVQDVGDPHDRSDTPHKGTERCSVIYRMTSDRASEQNGRQTQQFRSHGTRIALLFVIYVTM